MSSHHNKGQPWKADEGDAIHQTLKHCRANDGKNDRKATLHTAAVVKAVQCHERNVVLDGRPPPIINSEKELARKGCSTLAQLRSAYCRLLGSYKSRIKEDASLDVCADYGTTPHDVKHLFVSPAHLTILIPSDLWSRPTDAVRELSYLEATDPY